MKQASQVVTITPSRAATTHAKPARDKRGSPMHQGFDLVQVDGQWMRKAEAYKRGNQQ